MRPAWIASAPSYSATKLWGFSNGFPGVWNRGARRISTLSTIGAIFWVRGRVVVAVATKPDLHAPPGRYPHFTALLNDCGDRNLSQPSIQIFRAQPVVRFAAMRIHPADAANLLALPRRELFAFVETPSPCQQSLTAQNFVNPRNAAAELIRRVEDRRIGVRDLRSQRERLRSGVLQQQHGEARPHRPVAEQPADAPQAPPPEIDFCREIGHDVVVVPRVERNLPGAAAFRHRANHINRLIAIEGRNLDRHYVANLHKPPPERIRQDPPADRRLQIKPDRGNDGRHRATV